MTIRRISIITALVLTLAVGVATATAGRAPAGAKMGEKNLVQTAVAAGQFKTLALLLQKAGLVGTLEGKGPFTVFAPTDAAFAKVPKATLVSLAGCGALPVKTATAAIRDLGIDPEKVDPLAL